MSTYKFKVLKGGKVYGEATTKAEAEAVAKKIGGSVAEVGDKAARKVAAKKPKTSNPNSSDRSQKRVTVTLANGKKHTYLVYSTDDEIRAFNSGNVGYNDYGEPGPVGTFNRSAVVAVDIQPAKPKNPPLERANAASLLDAVKPGKPQVIHGVKVARVGAGYSIDRMVLSRELAIKRLEGGKVGNPVVKQDKTPERHTVKVTFSDGDTMVTSINGTHKSITDYYVGTKFTQWREPGIETVRYGKSVEFLDGTSANPKTKRAATPKGDASGLQAYTKLEKQRSDAVIAAHRCGAYVRGSDGETVCPNSEAQEHMDRARRIGADLDRRFPALTGGRYSNPKAKTRKTAKPVGPIVYI